MGSHQATLEEDVTLLNGQTSSSLTGQTSGLPQGQLCLEEGFPVERVIPPTGGGLLVRVPAASPVSFCSVLFRHGAVSAKNTIDHKEHHRFSSLLSQSA
jgi:hypothetical protein